MKVTPDMEPGVDVIKRELDFSKCRYLGEIHEVIREKFELPGWYGTNLDALWDSVTGIMYTPADITGRKEVRSQELKPLFLFYYELTEGGFQVSYHPVF